MKILAVKKISNDSFDVWMEMRENHFQEWAVTSKFSRALGNIIHFPNGYEIFALVYGKFEPDVDFFLKPINVERLDYDTVKNVYESGPII